MVTVFVEAFVIYGLMAFRGRSPSTAKRHRFYNGVGTNSAPALAHPFEILSLILSQVEKKFQGNQKNVGMVEANKVNKQA